MEALGRKNPRVLRESDKYSGQFDVIYDVPKTTLPNPACQVTCALIEFEVGRRRSKRKNDRAIELPDENEWDDLDRFKEAQEQSAPGQLTWVLNGGYASNRSLETAACIGSSQKAPMAMKKSPFGNIHGLCSNCSKLDLEQVLAMKPNFWGNLVLSLGPVGGDWVVSSCPFCNVLAAMRPHLNILGEEMESLALYAFRQSRYLWPLSSQGVLLAVLPFRDRRVDARQSAANTIETASFLCPVNPTESIRNGAKMKVRRIEPTKIDYSLLQKWIHTCMEKHRSSCNLRTANFDFQPIFIDCKRRWVVVGKVGEYVALSYVWGNIPLAGDFHPDSSLPETLPRTFEDAITVTKNLGYRYLWIDRYCLQADSKGETLPHSQNMDLIYRHAEVVIIAAFGNDPAAGLPGVSTVPRIDQPHATIGNHTLASTMHRPGDLIKSSTWATRAWTYQEALLARRRLVFTEEQVYFECWGMNCREAVDLEVDATELSLFGPKPGLRSPGAGGRAILETIAAYTARKLTYESDILNAFEGILKAYMQAEPSIRSYWGVPILPWIYKTPNDPPYTLTQGLLSGLCWQTSLPGVRRPGFPSWSWAGWTGTVSSESREYVVGVKQAFKAEIAVSVIHKGDGIPWEEMWTAAYGHDTLGTELPSTIYVYALTIEVRLVHTSFFTPADETFEVGFHAYPAARTPGGSCRAVRLSQAPGIDKELADGRPQEVFVGILLGRGDKEAKEMFVLIVRRVGDGFERLGSVQFSTVGDSLERATADGWFKHKKRKVIELG